MRRGSYYLSAQRPRSRETVLVRPNYGYRYQSYSLPSVSPGGDNSDYIRTTVKGFLNAAYDLNAFEQRKGYLTAAYDLNAFALRTGYLNGAYDLNVFTPQIGHLNAAYDIAVYTPVVGYLNASYDLNAFALKTGYLNAHYDLNVFTPVVGYVNAHYDLNVYQAKVGYLNGSYDLNAFTETVGYLNAHYDLNVFKPVVGYVTASYDLQAFTTKTGYLNASYDLNVYQEVSGYLTAHYDLNVYQEQRGYLNAVYDLLANEVFYGYAINLETGTVTKYENFNFNSLGPRYGAKSDGIYRLSGTTDNGTRIDWSVKTGKMALDTVQTRVTDAYVTMDMDGPVTLTMTADSGSTAYPGKATDGMKNRKFDLALGHKGKYWQAEIKNKVSTSATGEIDQVELIVAPTTRRIQ